MRCFVRTCQQPAKDQTTGHSLMLVTYRLSLDNFSLCDMYHVVPYDAASTDVLGLVLVTVKTIDITLKSMSHLYSDCPPVIVYFKARWRYHNVMTITVTLAYCCSTHETNSDIHRIDFPFRGGLRPWTKGVHLKERNKGERYLWIVLSSKALSKADNHLDDDETSQESDQESDRESGQDSDQE